MEHGLLTIALAFLEGLALILSPCILPILPIILSGSINGGKKRPLGIIIGFILSFAILTLFSRKLVQLSGIDLNIIRYISFTLLAILGIIMLSTFLTEKFNLITARLASLGASSTTLNNNEGGFRSGILFGFLVGIIWTPCAGPILAAVIVQTVLQKTSLESFFTVIAFAIGAGIPMLLIALFGRTLVARLGFLKRHAMILRKLLGLIILISVIYMINGETFTFADSNKNTSAIQQNSLIDGIHPYPAPKIAGITAWINSAPLTLSQLNGKVVLIDFWTYSCINCLRTLPYLKDWYKKYHSQGFEIIGIHAPEFDFEKNLENVQTAVAKEKIEYPVALDNAYITWQNYNNSYWPAHYLINKNGEVVYTHFGEGAYAETENNIRFLLGLNQMNINIPESQEFFKRQTPETYLGYSRAVSYASPETVLKNSAQTYHYPATLNENEWALQGKWIINSENIIAAEKNAGIKLAFHASKVFIVMGSSTRTPIHISIIVSNAETHSQTQTNLTVTEHTLYPVVNLTSASSRIIELITDSPGLELYTFTFG